MSVGLALPEVAVNTGCNYIAAFLTMACPYRCSYCINHFGEGERGLRRRWGMPMSGADWIEALGRLVNLERPGGAIPVTLQGGEPTCHPDFYEIVNGVPERIRLDVLTNLSFDVEEMIERVAPGRLRREAPYASIRVSYHPGQVVLEELLAKTRRLQEAGFYVGIWGVLHPEQAEHIRAAQKRAQAMGLDFRTKEFLGYAGGRLYGEYRYAGACAMGERRRVRCRTTELLIGCDGRVYRCHHDLYESKGAVGHIREAGFAMSEEFRECDCYGYCNPCDVKVKTNRLQEYGHTAVEIKESDK